LFLLRSHRCSITPVRRAATISRPAQEFVQNKHYGAAEQQIRPGEAAPHQHRPTCGLWARYGPAGVTVEDRNHATWRLSHRSLSVGSAVAVLMGAAFGRLCSSFCPEVWIGSSVFVLLSPLLLPPFFHQLFRLSLHGRSVGPGLVGGMRCSMPIRRVGGDVFRTTGYFSQGVR